MTSSGLFLLGLRLILSESTEVGCSDAESNELLTGIAVGAGDCTPVFVVGEVGRSTKGLFSVGVGVVGVWIGVSTTGWVGVVGVGVVVPDDHEPPPLPVCAAFSTLTVALAEICPTVSVCVKVSV